MNENYIFKGFGYCAGKYKITNSDIEEAIDKEFLQGFNKERVINNENYKKFCSKNIKISPLEYFAGEIMGFKERYSVTPFPPTHKKLYYSETSLDLAVKAIKNTLEDAEIQPQEIDAWFVSTVSPHEQAPGIATTIKSFFCKVDNYSATITTISGCAGFNINLEKALNFLKTHPESKNVVIAHTETMSSFLTQRTKYLPFVTFGDVAAAVVLTKINDNNQFGIINVNNFHDLKMLDYVGVDEKNNLFMDDKMIKDRAIINIPLAAKKCLEKSCWTVENVDIFVAHQTGNIIIKPAAEKLNLPKEKIYFEAQNKFANVSGATIPLSLCLLKSNGKLKTGTKILSATAGVGGNYGAFTYIHQKNDKINKFYLYKNDLKGKNILIFGDKNTKLSLEISNEILKRGATFVFCSVDSDLDKILLDNTKYYDYLIIMTIFDAEDSLNSNFYTPVNLINTLIKNRQIKNCILKISMSYEDFNFGEKDELLSASRAFHGYLASASGEFLTYGIKTIYLQTGFWENIDSTIFNSKEILRFMNKTGQEKLLLLKELAVKIINSIYLLKVSDVKYSYENAMLVGRIGYKSKVDI